MKALTILIPILGTVGLQAAPMAFTDVTGAAQINHQHSSPDVIALGYNHPQIGWMLGGAVAEDFNGDGLIDLYALQGGATPNLLYINCGGGVFKEEAAARGADLSHPGVGATAADYDNDGDIDICATSLNAPHYVLQNDGTGNFVIRQQLSAPADNVMSPSWGDLNNDGELDLVIARWRTTATLATYWNLGNGNLQLANGVTGDYFFSPVFADVNNDRWSDLLLVSDFVQTKYHLNTGVGTHTLAGAGSDENGMGTAVGDYDNDGDLDWFVSAIKDEDGVEGGWGVSGNRLYENDGTGTFTDVTTLAGVRDGYWGWGAAFADFDLDGDLDLFHVNGWAETFQDVYAEFGETPARLYENLGGGVFQEVALASGADHAGQGRGVAVFDLENDGDLDIFIVNNQDSSLGAGGALVSDPGTPVLLRNDSSTSNHWLKVHLAGAAPLHAHGIGSRVYVTIGAVTQMRELNASTGFLAHGPNRIAHFGLGAATLVDEVRAVWTNGDETRVFAVGGDQAVTVSSPFAQVSSRCVEPGVSVTMTAESADYPLNAILDWSVGGASYPNPGMVTFASAGTKSLRLDVYDGANPSVLLRTELLSVEVVDPDLDTDMDGIPNSWETANFMNPNNAADANLDNDSDGQTNKEEYFAGTNPNSFTSVLSLVSSPHVLGMKLTWLSVMGRQYTLKRSDDLQTWENHPSWSVPIPGTGSTNSIVVPTEAGAGALLIEAGKKP